MAERSLQLPETVRSAGDMSESVWWVICSWLPPESLIRFKYVCKSWYSFITYLINNPEFVAKHLHNAHNILSPKSFLIQGEYPVLPGPNYYEDILLLNISSDDEGEDEIRPVIDELEERSPWYMSGSHFDELMETGLSETEFYHCDGLICLIAYMNFVLWNPALLEFKILPPAINNFVEETDDVPSATGFGCDPVANDYKIIRIWTHDAVDIYSLNTNTWTATKIDLGEPFGLEYPMQVCYKGVCYWFIEIGDKHKLLSFDLHAEEFHIVPLPDPRKSSRTLQVWIDSIAFVSVCENEGTRSIEMWVTKNSSGSTVITDSSIWIKYLSIVPPDGIRAPLIFWRNDELLLEGKDANKHSWFVSYNLRTQKFRELIIDEVGHISIWGVPYVRSLISVNRRGQA